MKNIYFLLLMTIVGCKQNEGTVASSTPQASEITTNQTQIMAPNSGKQGHIKGLFYGCGYNYILNKNDLRLYTPNSRETNQIKTILDYSGLSQNFEIYSAPIKNAVATVIENRRYIIYDPKLLGFADVNSNSYWSSMSILAHEIGHHLQGHTLLQRGSTPAIELQADKFSGHILYKMGASLQQATAAINMFGSNHDTHSHPSKAKRIKAIKTGWEEAESQRFNAALPPPPSDDKNFGAGGYVKDKFYPDELISVNLKDYLGYSTIDGTEPLVEGIILESSGYDGQFSMTVLVTDDKNVNKDEKYFFGKGKKANVWVPEPGNGEIGSADLSWLKALLVPGRKIAFKPTSYGVGANGNGSWALIYIKKLNR